MSGEVIIGIAGALLAGIGLMFGAMRWLIGRADRAFDTMMERTDRIVEQASARAEKMMDQANERTEKIMDQARTDFDRLSRRMDELHNQERLDRHALGERTHLVIQSEVSGVQARVEALDGALRTEIREAERRCMEALVRHKIEDAARQGRPLAAADVGELLAAPG